MKRIFFTGVAALTLSLALTAQENAPPPPPAPHGFARSGPIALRMHHGKTVLGAPYSADVTTTVNRTLTDGNSIHRVTHGHVARDSEGRTYSQQDISGGPWAHNGPTTVGFISDPVAGYSYVLNPSKKVAMRRNLRRPPDAATSPHGSERPNRPSLSGETEINLGSRTIEGINCTGRSITHTIAAGTIGNAQPIIDKVEIWTSPELQTVVLSNRNDPRAGQSSFALSNIQRGEPDPSLFQVPPGYTVQDAPAWNWGRRER